jgi:hypothetical protein
MFEKSSGGFLFPLQALNASVISTITDDQIMLGKVGGEVKTAKFKLVSFGHLRLLTSISSTSYNFGDVIIMQPYPTNLSEE